jgi:hypothetical protein
MPDAAACGPLSFGYRANDGASDSSEATVSIVVNCQPQAAGDSVTVAEDSGPTTMTVLSNDTDPDSGQVLRVTAVGAAAHGLTAIAVGGIGVTYTPAPDYFGSDSFQYTISDGRGGTATGTVSVTVDPVNDAPSFVKGPDQLLLGNPGARTVSPWATAISAGPASEAGQTLAFTVTTDNAALFTVAPAVSPAGVLTYTPATDVTGTAVVTVVLEDDGGVANGGVDTSAARTFTISVNKASTATASASSSPASVVGAEITLTATVAAIAPGLGVPAGTITFRDGTTTLGAPVTLVNGAAAMTISSLGIGTHSLTAIFTPAGNFLGSSSAPIGQVVSSQPGLVMALAFDETTGTTAIDSSAAPRNGTIREAVRVTGGKFGRALRFDGVNDWVTVADVTASKLDLSTGMTLEAWVNPTSMSGWETVLMKERGITGEGLLSYALYAHDGEPLALGRAVPAGYVRLNNTLTTRDQAARGTTRLTLNTWTHLATTYDGTTQRFYVNGVLVGTNNPIVSGSTNVITQSNGALRIGGNASSTGEFFKGLIDEVRIYNRALTAAEIATDMAFPIR